ncbi:CAP domain-containing protein [Bacillus solimangrovi]|uniref:SCP domain-containing protein n=1 Tax=Bacillus solimangrovi TaxID=1305675 RepID=A0A1E5LEI3_9BACI|nr:CAP domain-containing protein [Bacillus solimangrovi]OEH92480.1 hypothetical protein BFG57_15585 [Bacillus solimangrovi]
MKKGLLLTTATAFTLLVSAPGMSSAASNGLSPEQIEKIKINCEVPQGSINAMLPEAVDHINKKYNLNINPENLNINYASKAPAKQEAQATQPNTPSQPAEAQTPAESTKQEKTEETSSALSQFEKEVVDLTNAERAKNGLAALEIDEELSKVARAKSADMQSNKYFDHNSPTYGSPFDMMKQFGISYKTAGENIAYGQKTPQEVVNAWMNSEGHRKNILNGQFTHIGVGFVEQGNYWTQMFIGK